MTMRWRRSLREEQMTAIGKGIGLLLITSLACAHAPTARPGEQAEVRAAIEATNGRFAAALKGGDAAALASLFTEDGEAIPAAVKGFVRGRAALQDYYAGRLRAARFLEVDITTLAVEVSGDLAWETGTNRVVVQSGDAPPVTRTGRYLVAWKRGADGRWRYRVDAIVPDPAG
jgi:uncharacterized protein (TIGR02246 family)